MTAIKTQEHTLGRWSLADLFPAHDGKEMKAAIKQLEDQAAAIEKWRDKLSADISDKDFLSILQAMETNTRLSGRVSQFAGLFFAEDTQNQLAQSFQAQIDQKMAELRNRTLFFSLWWKGLDDKSADRLMKASGEFEYYLRQMRNFKPYTLAEPEEKIINIKDVTGASTLQTLYSSLTDRYAFKVAVDGETKEYTRAQLMQLIYGPDPDLRAAAYQELYRVFSHDGPILGQIYQALSRDWHNENIDLRKFRSPIAVRNLSNDIPDEVVDTLLGVSEENSRVFQRFFNLKAGLLNTKKLRRYDIYAPVTSSDKRYSYEQAVNLTLDCFAEFDPKLETLAQQVFRAGHVDSEARKGKQGGAFCSSADPALMPWVLLNYTGLARDVSTLAHEFGHAIHAMLAGHHNVFNFHSSLPLAETASTFSEMLLVDKLLEQESDESVRRDILFAKVDDSYATIMRQVYFAIFERKAHDMVSKGTSADELSSAYMENLKSQFGDSLEIGDEFKWEWVSIPHIFYYPFYVYAYAFGQLLVFALYQQYKAEGAAFKPRYLELLSSGGSRSPDDILKRAGINMRDAAFWQGGFDVVSGMVDELEKLSGK
ncbi:MAG TPA: M3 family oligoendopeptidase [Anaerolineales bacterium]|nr:M3 family oligoendopeptidase [Anaerolineales bacterium]